MDQARVGLIEDRADMRELIKMQLHEAGHYLVLEADSFHKAAEAIEAAEPESIDVAIVDADLGKDASEGAEVIKLLRQKLGDIAIVGMSVWDPPEGADIKISKFKTEEIIDYINSL